MTIDDEHIADLVENIQTLEAKLLDFERSLVDKSADIAEVHILFREAHNLKGSLSILQKTNAAKIIHTCETYFDALRNRTLEPSTELIGKCIDSLTFVTSSIVGNSDSDEVNKIINGISELMSQEKGNATPSIEIQVPLNDEQRAEILSAKEKGWNLYQVEKLVSSYLDEDDLRELLVYDDIKTIGSHITTHPPRSEFPEGAKEATIKIIFVSDREITEISELIMDPLCPLAYPSNSDGESSVESNGTDCGKKILIIDSNRSAFDASKEILENVGNVCFADNANDALEMLVEAWNKEAPFQLVCLDMMLPEMSELQVLEHIRTEEASRGIQGLDASKIVVTSDTEDSSKALKCIQKGCEGYLTKPINQDELESLLSKFGFTSAS